LSLSLSLFLFIISLPLCSSTRAFSLSLP
jgi:hypothetical protein